MICPSCSGKLRVIDMVRDTDDVYRRRKCTVCQRFVYTKETEVEHDAEFKNIWAVCLHNKRANKEDKTND